MGPGFTSLGLLLYGLGYGRPSVATTGKWSET